MCVCAGRPLSVLNQSVCGGWEGLHQDHHHHHQQQSSVSFTKSRPASCAIYIFLLPTEYLVGYIKVGVSSSSGGDPHPPIPLSSLQMVPPAATSSGFLLPGITKSEEQQKEKKKEKERREEEKEEEDSGVSKEGTLPRKKFLQKDERNVLSKKLLVVAFFTLLRLRLFL